MPYVAVAAGRIYYEEHGRGFPVVLAHGAGGNHLSWWQQVPELSRHYRCITFDHRGWGLSGDEGGLGPEAFAEDLLMLADHLALPEVFLVGQSMGGLTCLMYTLRNPGRVRGLVMANSFAGMRREVWLACSEELRAEARSIWERRRSDGVRRALAPDFSRRHRSHAFLYKEIRGLNEARGGRASVESQVQRVRALERSPTGSARREELESLQVPVLFIGGEHDEVMPPALMKVAGSLIPRSQVVIVPGAGHSVYFEQPETFNHLLLEFFGACLAQGAPGREGPFGR